MGYDLSLIHIFANRKGDNLKAGIATLLLANTDWNRNVKADCVVMECDELNVAKVMADVPVNILCVNNFFRDQLDRAGEMETIIRKVSMRLNDYNGILVLNGDDPNVVRLKESAPHADVRFFGVLENERSMKNSVEASEGKFCPNCNAALQYDYYQYSHIGRFSCQNCGFGKIDYQICVTACDFETSRFRVADEWYHAPQNALYAMYNGAALLGVCDGANVSFDHAKEVLEHFELNDGRNETFEISGKRCVLNLVKNPTGANETMKFIEEDKEAKAIAIILNDNDQDGCDVSWIWDAHFERICDDDVKMIICSGKRAYDMALRFRYSDFQGKLIVKEQMDDAIATLLSQPDHCYVIATYTALQSARAILRRAS